MAGIPPPYPPPYPPPGDWKYQRKMIREQARAQRDFSRAQWKMYRDAQRDQVRGLRGSSILGPLVLITLGVIFFLHQLNRLSYSGFGAWYGRWWPLLLLVGGIVLLAEWAFERARAADAPFVYRSRGGVVVLLMLLCIPGILLGASHGNLAFLEHGFSVNGDNIDQFLGDRHESDQAIEQDFPGEATLTVNNPRGDVNLTGAGVGNDGQIHISVHKEVYSRSDSDAASKANQLMPSISRSGSAVTLNLPSIEGGHADITIIAPDPSRVTVTADHGTIHVASIHAPLTVTANHGDIELDTIGGPVVAHMNNRGSSFNAHSVAGQLTLEGNCHDVEIVNVNGSVSLGGDFFGTTHFERVNGPVRFHTSRTDFQLARLDGQVEIQRGDLTGDQILGPVSLSARSYNVNLERVAGDVSVTTSDGSVDLSSAPPMGNVTIQNRNGSVNLIVPENASFSVQAETKEGDVETDLPLSKSEENKINRLSGSVGNGKSLVRINTTQNDISLKKGTVAPLSPEPLPAAVPTSINPGPAPQSPKHFPGFKPPTAPPPPTTNF